MENEPLDQVLRTAVSREENGMAGDCPDDNKIAAYFDAGLRPDERAALELHVARCSSCRKVLALSMRLTDGQTAVKLGQAEPHRRVLFHFRIPVAALALVVIAAIAGALYFRVVRDSARPPAPAQTAELHPPVPIVSQPHAPPTLPVDSLALPQGKLMPEKPKKSAAPKPPDQIPGTVGASPGEELKQSEPYAKPERTIGLTAQQTPLPQTDSARMLPANNEENAPALKEAASASSGRDVQMLRAHSLAPLPAGAAARPTEAKARTIGDRTFTRVSGVWVDDECAKHPDAPAIELRPDSEEFAGLLQTYPGLGELRPLVLFWKGKRVSIR